MKAVDDVHPIGKPGHDQHRDEVAHQWQAEQLVDWPDVGVVDADAEPGITRAGRDNREQQARGWTNPVGHVFDQSAGKDGDSAEGEC